MSLQKGDKAPSFSLYDTEKNLVNLEDYKGKNLVILFFPMAFTGVCTAEMCSIRDDISIYDNLKTAVVGISVDSPFTLGKFKEEQKLNFPLLSDFNKEVGENYGVLYEEFVLGLKGVAKRSAFVVNGDGIIEYAEVLEKASDLPDFEAVKSALN